MVVFDELFVDISRHGDVKISFVIVPVECYATVQTACVGNCDILIAFDGSNEMIEVLLSVVFDPKVVYDKGELNWVADIFEESWCV